MNEDALKFRMLAVVESGPAFVHRGFGNARAEPMNGVELRGGGGVHDHHVAARAKNFGGEGYALGGVAGADRPNAFCAFFGSEQRDRVECATQFERTDGLEGFELEINFGGGFVVEQADKWGADGCLVDALACGENFLERDGAGGRRAVCRRSCHFQDRRGLYT